MHNMPWWRTQTARAIPPRLRRDSISRRRRERLPQRFLTPVNERPVRTRANKEEVMATKSSSKGKSKVRKVMKEHKEGKLKSGTGKKVKSRKQAVAIALSEARKSGAKIPKKKKKA